MFRIVQLAHHAEGSAQYSRVGNLKHNAVSGVLIDRSEQLSLCLPKRQHAVVELKAPVGHLNNSDDQVLLRSRRTNRRLIPAVVGIEGHTIVLELC